MRPTALAPAPAYIEVISMMVIGYQVLLTRSRNRAKSARRPPLDRASSQSRPREESIRHGKNDNQVVNLSTWRKNSVAKRISKESGILKPLEEKEDVHNSGHKQPGTMTYATRSEPDSPTLGSECSEPSPHQRFLHPPYLLNRPGPINTDSDTDTQEYGAIRSTSTESGKSGKVVTIVDQSRGGAYPDDTSDGSSPQPEFAEPLCFNIDDNSTDRYVPAYDVSEAFAGSRIKILMSRTTMKIQTMAHTLRVAPYLSRPQTLPRALQGPGPVP
ncbi:hypothetical protein DL766_003192 [Monosporascus sp. MC13-8B]|uniref:Uncharacterized protein n=1 Tax=Monosporascus cannonballus TaxID=155416 RepID=A0ABY0HEG2_9PEZI|nr:hypothetical protein DL762_002067 [Monosporascus cannonballus]RYO92166.1 hypothetical protein DL763_004781 [Monosporascus cannonballus]RYP34006.1 hypothetical protein DL766_003192 [Monosporascus sp. MC13-8B]